MQSIYLLLQKLCKLHDVILPKTKQDFSVSRKLVVWKILRVVFCSLPRTAIEGKSP